MMSNLRNLNPYERHKLIINEYVLNRPGNTRLLQRDTSRDKRDIDVIRENHKFLWEDEDPDETWEQHLAKKYYDKLFKQFSICDLSKYRENKVALRWRIASEVINGKGQFICGSKICSVNAGLRTWEVNFSYIEEYKKNALVKLRLCAGCSEKLNYRSQKREVKRMKKGLYRKQQKYSPHLEQSDLNLDLDGENAPEPEVDQSRKESADHVSNETNENSDEDDDNKEIWQAKTANIEQPDREQEFEKYLEDLLF